MIVIWTFWRCATYIGCALIFFVPESQIWFMWNRLWLLRQIHFYPFGLKANREMVVGFLNNIDLWFTTVYRWEIVVKVIVTNWNTLYQTMVNFAFKTFNVPIHIVQFIFTIRCFFKVSLISGDTGIISANVAALFPFAEFLYSLFGFCTPKRA